MKDEGAAEIAELAASVISERGHCKHTMEDNNGALCMFGGIHKAASMSVNVHDTSIITVTGQMQIVAEAVCRHLDIDDIPTWNDREETTGEDVVLALKHVAEELRHE